MNNKTEHNIYYIEPGNIQGDVFVISGHEFHHLKRVMRKKQGDMLEFTDGKGNQYTTEIIRVDRSEIHVHVVGKAFHAPAATVSVTAGFVPLKGHHNDFLLEKGTELGVHAFIAFSSRYSVLPHLGDQKIVHFNSIIMNAMLQSHQYHLPALSLVPTVEELVKNFKQYDQVLVADAHGRRELAAGAKKVLYVVGPEGGFDGREMALFTGQGACPLSLGLTRLRSETAAITGLIKIMTVYGIL